MNSIVLLVLYCFSYYYVIPSVDGINSVDNNYKLTIIHANDLYSAFGGVYSDNTLCDLNSKTHQCIGGAPKIVSKLTEWRSGEDVVVINAGNNLGGFWFKHFGPQVVTDFFKKISFDAINLGLSDYEFYEFRPDSGHDHRETFDNVTNYINEVARSSRIVSCNVDVDTKYISNFYSNVRKSTKMMRTERRKIAFIGFVKNPKKLEIVSTKRQSSDGSGYDFVTIRDPIKCLQEESESLRKDGIDVIVAVGSGDQELFKEIVYNVPNVDIVIGSYGYTKNLTFLAERTADTYPDLMIKDGNVNAVIATADIFGKSIGKLTVTFDKRGNVLSSEGTLIQLDDKIPSDPDTEKLVENYQRSLFIGTTRVFLDASNCMYRECNIGNLLADSLVFYRANYINETYIKSLIREKGNELFKARIDEKRDVIGLISSESISNSIGNVNMKGTDEYFITKISLDNMLNRKNPRIQMFILEGKTIRQLLSAHVYSTHLLHVSAMKVVYDLSKPINDTLIDVSVKCSLCPNNSYNELNDNKLYDVLLPQSITLDQNDRSLQVAQHMSLFDIVEVYIRENSPIKATNDNRLTLIGTKGKAFGVKSGTSMTLFCLLIAVCHLCL